MRILIAGFIGAVAMFIWATVAHTLTPLASIGLRALPDEASAMETMHASLGDKGGIYFFPFIGGGDAAAMAAQRAKLAVSPHGLIVYNPPTGQTGLSPRQMIVEFVLELVESILTAVVIAYAVLVGFAARVGIAAAVGAIAAIATNLSYWNWYGFSLDYSLANAFTEFMKFIFAGAAIAAFLAWRARKAA